MANDDQIIVDITVESKEVNQAEKSIDNLTNSIDLLGNNIKKARDENKKYKKSIEEINKKEDEGIKLTESEIRIRTKAIKSLQANEKELASNVITMRKMKGERNANIKLVNTEVNSRDRLRQKISLLTKEYNSLNTETQEGEDRAEKLEKELTDLNETLNDGSKAIGNFKDNIGNYTESINESNVGTANLIEQLEEVPGATGQAASGIKSIGVSFKVLIANPIVLFLTIIVGALTALFSAFKKSESGSKLLEKATAGLKGLFMIFTKIAGTLADVIVAVFEDPKQAVMDLWDIIKKNVVQRFEGLIKLFSSVGAALKALWAGDLDKLKKSALDAGQAMTQIATGLTPEELADVANAIGDVFTQAENLANQMIKLVDAQRAMRAQSRTLEKDIAVLSAEFERLGEITGDDTQDMILMRKAAIEAGQVLAELAIKQEKLAQIRLNTINQEVAIRRSAGEDIEDLLDQQAAAEVALTEARSQAAIAQQKILIEQRKIERDILEQRLDVLIDIGDKIKTVQEKAIANESLSLEKRKQLLEASKVALNANFSEIKKEYELYGITAEQINDVINTSDARQTKNKLEALGLNEIAINRLIEIIKERKQAELDFNDLSKNLSDEEIERKQIANDKIKELNDEITISQIDNAKELKDKLIEFEEAKLILLLENELLLGKEKELLILESGERIKEIENTFTEEKKEKDAEDFEERKELLVEQFEELNQITADFAGEEAALFGRIAAGIATAFEDGKVSAENALAGIAIASDAVFSAIAENRAKDLADNELARQAELNLAKGNKEAQAEINEKFDKKSAALKLKQFKADKQKAVIDIAINATVAAVKALPNIPLSIVIAGLGIAAGILVAAKKPPTFGDGTSDIVNIGGSHASGNDTDVWGFSGGQKQYFGKVERDEVMPVIKRSAANAFLVARLNGKFSGKGKMYQDGTADITNENQQSQNNEQLTSALVSAISDISIVAKIEDITKQVQNKIQIVDNSKV